MNKDIGASASGPGSREPSPDGLGPTGFDPSRVAGLPLRLCEVVRHRPDCPGISFGDDRCECDAVATLADVLAALEWLEAERAAWEANARELYEIGCIAADAIVIGDWRADGMTPVEAILDAISDSDGSPKGGDAEGGSVRSTTARPEGIAQ